MSRRERSPGDALDRADERMETAPRPVRCPECGYVGDHHPACPEQVDDLPYPDEEYHDIDD